MMASSIFSHTCSILLVLVFLSSWAESDTNMPLALPPFSDNNLCDVVNCGRGNCSVDVTKPYSFVCECEPGWRRTRSDNEDKLQFLPCVIPDCTLDYSCMPAPPPSPPIPPIPDNISLFDPCYWTYCGEGTCTKNLTYTHTCQCNPGYTNLMNISHFPCFSSCAIGMDCRRLGISMQDTTSPPNDSNSQGSPPNDSNSQGTKFLHGGFHWIGFIIISVVMAIME